MKINKLATLAVALFASTGASAVLATECTVALSATEADFGVLNRDTAPGNGEIPLGLRPLSLNISCAAPSDMTMFYRALAGAGDRFVLGPEGSYQLMLSSALLDGSPVELGEVRAAGEVPTNNSASRVVTPGRGLVPTQGGLAVKGQQLQAQIEVKAFATQRALSVRDKANWQAEGLIELPTSGSSRNLSVMASSLPVACTPTLSNGGVVDFGNHSLQNLNRSSSTQLSAKTVSLDVSCDAPARFAISALDNRSGTSALTEATAFGLGLDRRGKPIGHYAITLSQYQTSNSSSAFVTQTLDSGNLWSAAHAAEQPLSLKAWYGFSDIAAETSGPSYLTQSSVTMSIEPTIARTDTLDTAEVIDLDGSATIEIQYL